MSTRSDKTRPPGSTVDPPSRSGPARSCPISSAVALGRRRFTQGWSARKLGENLVVVLGHADYYPRFGFSPASRLGITAPFEAPDDNFLALTLNPDAAVPRGEVAYAKAFGV